MQNSNLEVLALRTRMSLVSASHIQCILKAPNPLLEQPRFPRELLQMSPRPCEAVGTWPQMLDPGCRSRGQVGHLADTRDWEEMDRPGSPRLSGAILALIKCF